MERFELDDGLAGEIRAGVSGAGFMKLVQSARRGGHTIKASLRPVEIGGALKYQLETSEDGRVKVRNLDGGEVPEALDSILGQKGPRDIHLIAA